MANEGEGHTSDRASLDAVLILGALAVGAAVALLYAPRSGERTRRQLRRRYEDLRDRAADLGDDLVDRVEELRQLVARRVDASQDYVGQKKEDVLAGLSALQESLDSLKQKLSRR